MCHLILESCKKNTLQRKQYSNFDSFSVRFEVSFSVLLSFPLWDIPHSTVLEKMKTPVLGKVGLWKRLGQASHGRKVLGSPACKYERLENPLSAGKGLFLTPMVHYAFKGCLL